MRRIYDNEQAARKMREVFADRPVERKVELPFDWPHVMRNVGDSLAVGYSSDKWKKPNGRGEREWEACKHLAESRNRALVLDGVLFDGRRQKRPWPVVGPLVSLDDCPLPRHFAVLALFEELNLQLYTEGTDEEPAFGKGPDDGVVQLRVRHGILGGAEMCWSRKHPGRKDQPFLFVYTEDRATIARLGTGILMVVVGDKLDVKRDGIVG